MNIERKNYDFLGEPVGPYTHAVKHSNILYLSGLTAFGTEAETGSLGTQIKEIFRQIETIANTEGSGLHNILKVTLFVSDFSEIHELRDTLFEIYRDNIPASSLVQVAGLFAENLKIEIEVIIALQ